MTPEKSLRPAAGLNAICRCGHTGRIHGTHALPGRGTCRACPCHDHRPPERNPT